MVDLALIDEKPQLEVSDPLLGALVGNTIKKEQLSELDRVACFLVAKGHSYEEAGSLLGVGDSVVERWRTSRTMFRLVLSIQSSMKMSVREQIMNFAPSALQRKMELVMFSENENVVNAATSFILEQAEGKATQRVEMSSINFNAQLEAKELDSALKAAQQRLANLEAERQKIKQAEPVHISD